MIVFDVLERVILVQKINYPSLHQYKLSKFFIMGLAMRKSFISFIIFILPITLLINKHILFAQDTSDKIHMLEIVISNLISRVEALEKRVNELEKKPLPGITKDTFISEDISKYPHMEGFEEIGNGLFAGNIRFEKFGSNVLFTGKIANKSQKNYRFIKFILEMYDDRNVLVKKEVFTIPDLPKNSTKPFETMLVGIEASLINRYVIKVAE
ncbi:MAG: hypothetical protein E3K32_06325 [wastewater metagenome]|nr:hypothetical protein [Candidatus Loosdrechtia aerotolerans]